MHVTPSLFGRRRRSRRRSPARVPSYGVTCINYSLICERDNRPLTGCHLPQILIEELQCAFPRQLGRFLVVARRRIVVETVIGSLVYVAGVGHVVGLQGFLIGGPSAGYEIGRASCRERG